MSLDFSVIIPTFNESETIQHTILTIDSVLQKTNINYEILIVDDNSPDKTGNIVAKMSVSFPVRLITRTSDPGLSQSVIEGFKQARGNIIAVTDADLSHDVSILPQMYETCLTNDVVIGSRYMQGGGIKDWPFKRRIISWGATFLSKILFPSVTDPVSGFFAVKKELVFHTNLQPCGYKILLEILGKSYWHTVYEIPYVFTNRTVGDSKLRSKTIFDFIRHLITIARFPGRASREITKIKKFALVGFTGVFVNSIALAFLVEWLSFPIVGASFLSVEIAIISNFVLNDSWTFKDHKNINPWLHRLISFNSLCVGGLIINVAVLGILSSFGLYYLISNLFGIGIAMSWNFLSNRKLTWKN
jgi:dolichol-phosphate mannosyltransferase